MSSSKQSIELSYAPPPPWYHQRIARRIGEAIAAICLLVVVLLWAPYAIRYWKAVYWERQCLRSEFPPDKIVYDFAELNRPLDLPVVWQRYAQLVTPTARPMQLVYLHERRAPNGNRRLIAVDFAQLFYPQNEHVIELYTHVMSRAGWFSLPHEADSQEAPIVDAKAPYGKTTFRMFAGQTDPMDESHFTIDYEVNGRRETLNCWLRSDDFLRIDPPPPNPTPPPPSSAASSH